MADPNISIHPVALAGFQNEESYDKQRPRYNTDTIEFIKGLLPSTESYDTDPDQTEHYDIVEIGSGTGKFTRSFLDGLQDNPVRYLATEPMYNMLDLLKKKCPGVTTAICTADSIPLPDCSTSFVVAAASFHWFADEKSLAEILRILRPGGGLVMVWQTRSNTIKWIKELHVILDALYMKQGVQRMQWNDWKSVFRQVHGLTPLQEKHLDGHTITGSVDDMVSYFSSLSVIVALTGEEKKKEVDVIRNHLLTHPDLQDKDILEIPFDTDIFWCQKI